jgi:uncharacterized protein (DUF1697 family)
MPQYFAFLRGINLGKRRLKMEVLRARFEEMKFRQVATFIASGNVVFTSGAGNAAALERKIEGHLAQTLGYAVDTYVRTRAELEAIATFAAFPASQLATPEYSTLVILLKEALAPELARQLIGVRSEVDEFNVRGREIYWWCRIKMSDSTIWSRPEVKTLRLPSSTMRNRNTLLRLVEEFPVSR